MALIIDTLATGSIQYASTLIETNKETLRLYAPATGTLPKVAIVNSMRFTNPAGASVKMQVFFLEREGDAGETEGDPDSERRRLLPKDVSIPPGMTVIDDEELTLGSGDGIYACANYGDVIHYVITGVERDA
jgi:hypothetical protein